MTLHNIDYSKAVIYFVKCSETNKIYIGSTTRRLCYRIGHHRSKHNTTSTKDFINPTIHLLEKYPCENREQLLKKERFFVESLPCVNKNIPGRTAAEWQSSNKGMVQDYRKKRYDEIGSTLKQISRNYYNEISRIPRLIATKKKQIKKILDKTLEKDLTPFEAQKLERFRLIIKQYEIEQEGNDKINNKVINCKCGMTILRRNMELHLHNKIHIKKINASIASTEITPSPTVEPVAEVPSVVEGVLLPLSEKAAAVAESSLLVSEEELLSEEVDSRLIVVF